MESPAPIPSPWSERWRQIRFKVIHIAMFVAICCGAALAWKQLAQPLTFVGQAEVIQATVTTPEAGLLTNLWVTSFQQVKAGDLMAEISTTDPHTLNNRLEAMRDRMRLTELEMGPVLSRQRNALEYEQLSLACARAKTDLAMSQLRLLEASNELQRVSQLLQRKEKTVSQGDLDLAKTRMEAIKIEVEEKGRLVESSQKGLDRLAFLASPPGSSSTNDPLKEALSLEQAKLKTFEEKMKPLQLLAPIKGTISAVHHQAGEQLAAGQPIVTITSQECQRILGFLPQSFPITPQVGMTVEVRTRSYGKKKGLGKITGLGPNLESITNTLVSLSSTRSTLAPPVGRPVSISLPAGLRLLPGELVEITIAP